MFFTETRQKSLLSNETASSECGGVQKILVEEKTSSALIIMGIFFIVVVIGLFYYLPQWSPAQSGSCMNPSQTDSANGWNLRDGPLLRGTDIRVQTKNMHSDNSITFAHSDDTDT